MEKVLVSKLSLNCYSQKYIWTNTELIGWKSSWTRGVPQMEVINASRYFFLKTEQANHNLKYIFSMNRSNQIK